MQKIFITSSRSPSSKLLKFLKDLEYIFPYSQKINRGSEFLISIVSFCLVKGVKNLILVYENRSRPSALVISNLPIGPSVFFTLSNVFYETNSEKLKKVGKEVFPNVIFDNLGSNLGLRISDVLGSLFPPTDFNSKRIITFTGYKNIILFGQYWAVKTGYRKENFLLKKLSPSFELQPFKITLDIVSKKRQKNEWILTPFLESRKKKTFSIT